MTELLQGETFVCCDPGSGGTGFALFSEEHIFPIETKVVSCDVKDWWMKRKVVLFGCADYLQEVRERGCTNLLIEKPQFMESIKGLTAARTDNLLKLIFVYACIVFIGEMHGMSVKNIEINSWKGQLNKDQVNHRLEKIVGRKFADHEADAVGMGLYVKGLLGG